MYEEILITASRIRKTMYFQIRRLLYYAKRYHVFT